MLLLLGELAKSDDPPVVVLFVIRSDSYDALQHAKTARRSEPKDVLSAADAARAYQTVIERPAQRLQLAGRRFVIDPALSKRCSKT